MSDDKTIYEELGEERKELQSKGLLPEWYTTAGYQILKSKYLDKGETPYDRYRSVASTAARHTEDPELWEERFFELLWKGWLSPATPVLTNMGKPKKGTPVSCSGSYVGDSVFDFYDVQKEIAVLSQNGFGTSAYLGDIRPRGSKFAENGNASGILPVLKDIIQVSRDITQGNNRRGAVANYVPIDHGDFYEVADYLFHYPDDNNLGWVLTKDWYDKIRSGDKDALKRYQRVMKIRSTLGKGYLQKQWVVDDIRPHMYKDLGLDVKASQLCVTGDQIVISDRGMKTALELYNEGGDLKLFDNDKIVNSSPMKKIEEDVDVFKITLSNGMEHTVTGYHKVKTERGMISASELNENDRVYFQTNEGLFGNVDMQDEAFLLGLYQADGTQNSGRVFLNLWENDFDLVDEVKQKFDSVYDKHDLGKNNYGSRKYPKPDFTDCFVCESVTGTKIPKKTLGSVGLSRDLGFKKGSVPDWVFQGTKETQWQYLRGLFIADGTVNVSGGKGNPLYLSITNTNRDFLKQLQLILSNLGCKFSIYGGAEEGYKKLPDGEGGYSEYWCKQSHRLVCGNKPDAMHFENNTGLLKRKGVILEDRDYRDNTKKCSKVISVEYVGKEDVYCVTVDSNEHLWVCNGVVTSNCTEILLHSSELYTYTCVLSSMNLIFWDDWKDTDAVFWATVFLDCVAEEFIQVAKSKRGLEKAIAFTEKSRALGLGVMGLHSLYQEKMLPFDSFDSMMLNNKIFKHLHDESLRASQWMAQEWGEPEWCKGYGVRNTHRTAVAPTMSTALLMGGGSQGIEPFIMNVFSQVTSGGTVRRINPLLVKIMKERGVFDKKHLDAIERDAGSVRNCDFLTDHEKKVFLTAFEINQMAIIRQASQRQPNLCQTQSVNTFFAADETEEWISEVTQTFIEDPNMPTLYYQRSMSGVKASKGEACEACQ